MADTASIEAPTPTVPDEIAQLGGNVLHAAVAGIPPEQDRCDCASPQQHLTALVVQTATARDLLQAVWPAIAKHFARLNIIEHSEGMRCLADARENLERRVADLQGFEGDYRSRLEAHLTGLLQLLREPYGQQAAVIGDNQEAPGA